MANIILVTGFGPFNNHTVNPSWEAILRGLVERPDKEHFNSALHASLVSASDKVALLERIREDIRPLQCVAVQEMFSNTLWSIFCVQLPVVYEEVKRSLPALVKLLNPKHCIHCGVGRAGPVRLESTGYNLSYTTKDVTSCLPDGGVCVADGPDTLRTSLPLERIAAEVTSVCADKVKLEVSTDPGRFLCCFIYYYSLHLSQNASSSVFVHVPPIGSPSSVEELGDAIFAITQSIASL